MKLSEIQIRRKRLIMRAEHRGIKEMDIIMGGYVRANVEDWDLQALDEMESLMSINDQTLYAMIAGHEGLHPDFADRLKDIQSFVNKG